MSIGNTNQNQNDETAELLAVVLARVCPHYTMAGALAAIEAQLQPGDGEAQLLRIASDLAAEGKTPHST